MRPHTMRCGVQVPSIEAGFKRRGSAPNIFGSPSMARRGAGDSAPRCGPQQASDAQPRRQPACIAARSGGAHQPISSATSKPQSIYNDEDEGDEALREEVRELRGLLSNVIAMSRSGQQRMEATLQKVLAESSTSSVIEKSMLRLLPSQQTAQNEDSDDGSG